MGKTDFVARTAHGIHDAIYGPESVWRGMTAFVAVMLLLLLVFDRAWPTLLRDAEWVAWPILGLSLYLGHAAYEQPNVAPALGRLLKWCVIAAGIGLGLLAVYLAWAFVTSLTLDDLPQILVVGIGLLLICLWDNARSINYLNRHVAAIHAAIMTLQQTPRARDDD